MLQLIAGLRHILTNFRRGDAVLEKRVEAKAIAFVPIIDDGYFSLRPEILPQTGEIANRVIQMMIYVPHEHEV